jgi:uncharacterized repeat protein (TIGR03803 family)
MASWRANTVFQMGFPETGWPVQLHTFTNKLEGNSPNGGLVLAGSTVFGTTVGGGTHDNGTVFEVDNDGTNFRVLHSFTAFGRGFTNDDAE